MTAMSQTEEKITYKYHAVQSLLRYMTPLNRPKAVRLLLDLAGLRSHARASPGSTEEVGELVPTVHTAFCGRDGHVVNRGGHVCHSSHGS